MNDPHVLESAQLRVILSERGSQIASILHTPTDSELLFRAPWADDEFDDMGRMADSDREWHRRYSGGWHPLIPHAGDAATIDGVEHPFHGEAAWRRWTTVRVDGAEATLALRLRTVPLVLERTTSVAGDLVRVRQLIANESSTDVAITWTEHPAFGGALLGPATTWQSPEDTRIRFPSAPERWGAFTELSGGDGVHRLVNPERGIGIELSVDRDLFPITWVWQEHRATTGYPWWGVADTIGVEPSTRGYHDRGDGLGSLVVPGRGSVSSTIDLRVISA